MWRVISSFFDFKLLSCDHRRPQQEDPNNKTPIKFRLDWIFFGQSFWYITHTSVKQCIQYWMLSSRLSSVQKLLWAITIKQAALRTFMVSCLLFVPCEELKIWVSDWKTVQQNILTFFDALGWQTQSGAALMLQSWSSVLWLNISVSQYYTKSQNAFIHEIKTWQFSLIGAFSDQNNHLRAL